MICTQKITQKAETSDFSCGNGLIEQQIRDSYFSTLLHEGYAHEILLEGQVVGYYMIKLVSLYEHEVPEIDQDLFGRVYSNRLLINSAVEITYLGIDIRVQRRGIGSTILDMLNQDLMKKSIELPFRYIIINALSDKVSWYYQKGFRFISPSDKTAATRKMFMDCIPDRQIIEAYIQDIC